jgi:hypothetical protein
LWHYAWSDGINGLWLSGYGFHHLNIEDHRNEIMYSNYLPAGVIEISEIDDRFNDHFNFNGKQFFVSQNGLYFYNGNDWTEFLIPKTVERNEIYGLGISPNNDIFVSTPISTQKTDGTTWIKIGGSDEGVRAWNKDFIFAPDGRMFTNYNSLYPRTHKAQGLDIDGQGNIWHTYPVTKFTWPNLNSTEYTSDDMGISPPPNGRKPQFMDIVVDKYDQVWTAGWYGYAAKFDGDKWHPFSPKDIGVPSLDIDDMFTDSKGRVWLFTNTTSPNWGLIKYEKGEWSIYNFPGLVRGQFIYQAAEDHFGNLWMASWAGLLKYDGTNWSIHNKDNSPLNSSNISAVTVDQRGNIWIGVTHQQFHTGEGIYIFNPVQVDFTSDINSSPVSSLSITPYGYGVKARFKPKKTNSGVFKYELQRGKKPHKFWLVAELSSFSPLDSVLEIIDSSFVTGDKVYRIKEISNTGQARYSSHVLYSGLIPIKLLISNNYPNPFNASTNFDLEIPYAGNVKIKIYDILGRLVKVAFDEEFEVGYYTMSIDMKDQASGIYFYNVEFNSNNYQTGKLVLLK